MISAKITKAINDQITKEFHSSFLYLAMSAHFTDKNLDGFAGWFMAQSREEYGHAMKLYHYLTEQNASVTVDGFDKPKVAFDSVRAVIEAAYKHEQFITSSINAIMETAVGEKDYATQGFLGWFVKEQVEEEKSVLDVLQKLDFLGESNAVTLYMLDKELGARAAS